MKNIINIGNKKIGLNNKPFIIAEMSGNHNRSIERALEIIDAAAKTGADAIKLQTYTPDTMTIDVKGGLFDIDDPSSLWKGKNLYELYKEAHTPWEWHKELFARAQEKGLIIFSTPFDETAVDFLEDLGAVAYKIASFENNDHPLLIKVAKTKKPVIMSTGVSTLSDIQESIDVLRSNGCEELVLLKCTSTYPAPPEDINLLCIPDMAKKFNCLIGLSDHTKGIGTAIASVALGACVIEKHFTLSRNDGGVDSAFSIEPEELSSLVYEVDNAFKALGKVKYGIQNSEEKSVRFKRSIYIIKDIKKGEKLSRKNIRIIRPGNGLEPKHFIDILGKKIKEDVKAGSPLSWNNIE